jgi:predicted PurR-regulated permease PerM
MLDPHPNPGSGSRRPRRCFRSADGGEVAAELVIEEQNSPLPPLPPSRQAAIVYRAVLLAALLVVLGLLFREVLTLLLAGLLTVILALPLVAWTDMLERRKVPRPLGAISGLLLFLVVVAGLFALIVPTFVEEARNLVDELPEAAEEGLRWVSDLTGLEEGQITGYAETALAELVDPNMIARIGVGLVSGIAGILLILVTTLYIAMRPGPLASGVMRLFPPHRRDWAEGVADRLREAWLGWLKGSVISMVVIGALIYVGLLLIGVPYALAFAVLAGLLEFIPYIGPIVAAIPAIIVAFSQGVGKGIATVALYVIVNQVEGNVTVPLIMSKAVDLHPAVVAVGLVVVGAMFGIVGLFVAVPLIVAVLILVEEVWVKPREKVLAEARAGPPPG